MDCNRVVYSRHSVERMFERGITPEGVLQVIRTGEVIASYPEDTPYPSQILLGSPDDRPVHIIVARDAETGTCYVVTVYRPDPQVWEDGFRARKKA